MRKLIYSLLWAVCGMSAAPAQAQHAFRVMEYNVENLFDCRHDSLSRIQSFAGECTELDVPSLSG